MANIDALSQRHEAINKMQESVRDLNKLTIKLPLGNPSLKYVHTNQWLFTDLPKEFYLTNLAPLMNALNGTYNRYTGFQENRWYIEGVTINNDGTTATIELNVNPMASSLSTYTEANNKSKEDYVSAVNSSNNNVATKEKTSKKSTTLNEKGLPKLYDVKGWSKSDQEFIKKVVAAALKKAGYPQDPVKQAYWIHDYYRVTHHYSKYDCMKYYYNHGYGFEKTWNVKGHNCGEGAVTIQALLYCIGLKPVIYNGHNHFWIKVKINGTMYYCDQAGASGASNSRHLGSSGGDGNVWGAGRGGSARAYRYMCRNTYG